MDLVQSPQPKKHSVWVAGLQRRHENIFLSNDWLDDKLVNAGQDLIKELFPYVSELQDVKTADTCF